MISASPTVERDRRIARWVQQYGGSVAPALLDSSTALFQVRGIEGAIGYRRGWGCAVAIGDPVSPSSMVEALADAFREHCRARGWRTVYAVAGPVFCERMLTRGYAAMEFGEELILDPRRDPTDGARGRELRKKVNRARRAGVTVDEWQPGGAGGEALERAIGGAAQAWLAARRGPQIYLGRIRPFADRECKRCFYARRGARVVGVLSLVRLAAHGGYLLDHLIATPDAPPGTTELCATEALRVLGDEGCAFASFGPAPSLRLGRVVGLPPLSEFLARVAYRVAGRVFHLDTKMRYRRKFLVARTEPSYLLFDPPQLSLGDVPGVLRAFNVSLPRTQKAAPSPRLA